MKIFLANIATYSGFLKGSTQASKDSCDTNCDLDLRTENSKEKDCFANKLFENCYSLLSEDEKQRFSLTKSEKGRRQFLFGRALLRLKLAEELKCQAKEIQFILSPNGRPELAFPKTQTQFSLSHSGDFIILAISLPTENIHPKIHKGTQENKSFSLGIDLEKLKNRNFIEIAKHFFEEEEIIFLTQNQASDKNLKELFYTLWTLKESFVKVLGESIYNTSARLRFSLDLDNKKIHAKTSRSKKELQEIIEHKFATFKLDEDYIFSVAYNHEFCVLETEPQIVNLEKYFQKELMDTPELIEQNDKKQPSSILLFLS